MNALMGKMCFEVSIKGHAAYRGNMKIKQLLVTLLLFAGTAWAGPFEDALTAHERKDYAAAMRIFLPMAAQGNAGAQYNLGTMYFEGKGVAQDIGAAVNWFKLSAAGGHAGAQYNLGVMHGEGQHMTQNHVEAKKWYGLAAAQGLPDAQHNLGVMFDRGNGGLQDYAEAVKWYRLAAAQAYANSQFNLGEMYYSGQGVTKDYIRSHMWFNLSAALGNTKGMKRRQDIALIIPPSQLGEAQKLARECLAKNYKGCK